MLHPVSALLLLLILTLTNAHTPPPLLSKGCTPHTRAKPSRSKSGGNIISSLAGGGSRPFILDLPPTHSPQTARPLILAFHDANQSALRFKEETRLSERSDAGEYILAYPAGMSGRWTGTPDAPPASKINDVGLANDLITQLTGEFCVDLSRIYAVGFGNGGALVDFMACDPRVSARLAAVAIVGGSFYEKKSLKDLGKQGGKCDPKHIMPVLEIHGANDPVANYSGTPGKMISIPVWLARWAKRAGCNKEEVAQNESDLMDEGTVGRGAWSCKKTGLREAVVHYFLMGVGHEWLKGKAGNKKGGSVSKKGGEPEFDATSVVLEFFEKWRLGDTKGEGTRKDEL